MKSLCAFSLLCVLPNLAFGGIGQIDKRQYVDWTQAPYNNYVAICSGDGCGTGEFVSHKYIITNKHVAECCGIKGQSECAVYTSKGETVFARVVATGNGLSDCKFNNKRHLNSGLDWSIIEVLDRDYIKKRKDNNETGWDLQSGFVQKLLLQRAGFGDLKVLTNEDIKNIKQAYVEFLVSSKEYEADSAKARVDKYGGELENWGSIYNEGDYTTFKDAFKKNTGKDFTEYFLDDFWNIKAIHGCTITGNSGNMLDHTCDGWHGDSGSAILDANNKIVALHNSGYSDVGSTIGNSWAVPVTGIVSALRILKQNDDSEISPEPPLQRPPFNPVTPSTPELRDDGDECIIGDLPPHAVSGHYIKSGSKKLDCKSGNVCSCAATKCESGYYLVVNSNGNSQGWCYKRRCPAGQHLNIIDDVKTDTKCVDD